MNIVLLIFRSVLSILETYPADLGGTMILTYFSTIEGALEEVEKRITDIKERLSKVRNRMLELGTEEARLEELLCTRILVTDKGNYCTYQDAKTGKRINLSSGCYYKVGTTLYLYDGFKLNKYYSYVQDI